MHMDVQFAKRASIQTHAKKIFVKQENRIYISLMGNNNNIYIVLTISILLSKLELSNSFFLLEYYVDMNIYIYIYSRILTTVHT